MMGKVYFFVRKPKRKLSGESWIHFLDIEKNFPKTKFKTNLTRLRTVEVPRSIKGIAKLGTIRELFARQIFYRKLFSDNIWNVNNVGNMSQMKRFKNTIKRLIIS